MKLYLVTANCDKLEDCFENVYTVVTHKKDAYYWIYKFIIMAHYNHYEQWCENKGLDKNSYYVELKYVTSVWSSLFECFAIIPQKLNHKQVAERFRLYMNCTPVGCYWETDLEYENAKKLMEKENEQQVQVAKLLLYIIMEFSVDN